MRIRLFAFVSLLAAAAYGQSNSFVGMYGNETSGAVLPSAVEARIAAGISGSTNAIERANEAYRVATNALRYATNAAAGIDSNAWHFGDSVTGAVDDVSRASIVVVGAVATNAQTTASNAFLQGFTTTGSVSALLLDYVALDGGSLWMFTESGFSGTLSDALNANSNSIVNVGTLSVVSNLTVGGNAVLVKTGGTVSVEFTSGDSPSPAVISFTNKTISGFDLTTEVLTLTGEGVSSWAEAVATGGGITGEDVTNIVNSGSATPYTIPFAEYVTLNPTNGYWQVIHATDVVNINLVQTSTGGVQAISLDILPESAVVWSTSNLNLGTVTMTTGNVQTVLFRSSTYTNGWVARK